MHPQAKPSYRPDPFVSRLAATWGSIVTEAGEWKIRVEVKGYVANWGYLDFGS